MDLISVNNFRRKKSLRYFALLFFFLMMCPCMVSAQNTVTIGGTVNSKGEPLIGAVVKEKGTTKATATNIDGVYFLTVQENAILEISYVGYKTKEIKVNGQKMIDIELEENVNMLDEVVAIGYGVQQKKLVTGATVQVKGDVIAQQNTVSPLSGLQGLTPGVSIVKNNGKPGEGFNVLIRGAGTMHDSEPLCIIDGQPGDLNVLNPSDIETVDILKDAASAAIYGARAANGVILVTTKQAQKGKTNITYDGYVGIQNFRNNVETTGARDYLMLLQEAGLITEADLNTERIPMLDKINNGEWDGTNWLDEMTQKNAPIQNHAININKGSENSAFTMGFSYTSQKPTVAVPDDEVGSGFDRYTIRLNSEHTLIKLKDLDLLKVGETMTMVYSDKKGLDQATGQTTWNDFRNAFKTSPLFPAYDEATGEFADPVKINKDEFNPVAKMYYNSAMKQSKNYSLNGNFYLILEPLKNLRWRNNFGIRYSSWSYRGYVPAYNLNGSTEVKYRNTVTQQGGMGLGWQFESTLSYDFSINNQHKFSALLGTTIDKSGLGENYSGSNEDVEFDDFFHAYLGNAKTVEKGRTTLSGSAWGVSTLASFFGRINYGYKDKYLATFTLRADGSSSFAKESRWGWFPSVALAWKVNNEAFLKDVEAINSLKLRLGWGVVGNQWAGSYAYGVTMASAASIWGTGFYAGNYPNRELKWEETNSFNVGLDLALFNNRIEFIADAYYKKTDNLLMQASLPTYVSGLIRAPWVNAGAMTNKGVEFTLNTHNIQTRDFTWTSGLTFSINHNEVTKLYSESSAISGINGSETLTYTMVGEPVGQFYGYKVIGMFKEEGDFYKKGADGNFLLDETGNRIQVAIPKDQTIGKSGIWVGDYIYEDRDNNGVIDEKDRTFLGNPAPKFTFGFNNYLSYKGFDLNIFLNGSVGNKAINLIRRTFTDPMRNSNLLKEATGIAQIAMHDPEVGDEVLSNVYVANADAAKVQRITTSSANDNNRISDRFVEDASYLRIKNISLGYTFPQKWLRRLQIDHLRLYVNIQNLCTITGYKGYDPEIGALNYNVLLRGVDDARYPSQRIYTFGLNFNF